MAEKLFSRKVRRQTPYSHPKARRSVELSSWLLVVSDLSLYTQDRGDMGAGTG